MSTKFALIAALVLFAVLIIAVVTTFAVAPESTMLCADTICQHAETMKNVPFGEELIDRLVR